MRLIKIPVLMTAAVLVLSLLLFGTSFPSYLRTSFRSARHSVQGSVPVEFELQRARDMIDAILPQLQAQVRMIAEEEVEIAGLQSDIERSVQRLESERTALLALRKKADTTLVSVSAGERELPRSQWAEQLHGRFERFKQTELAVQSKQRLLEGRRKSLEAGLVMLEKTRDRKIELQQKVETLAAENRLVKASQIVAGRLIDGSQLSKADELLSEIQTRLDVAQRVLMHEQDLEEISDGAILAGDWVDETQMLDEIDQHLGLEG